MKTLRILLLPVSWIYGCITWLRNLCFDFGILPEREFNIPIIALGNLKAGGTGKTPHVEYIIDLLNKENKLAALSRGYGRITSGFRLATETSTSRDIGDEPKQIKQKFRDKIIVAVDADRVKGIKRLQKENADLKAIILDDAYQHRYVKPGINILLTPYNKLYINDQMLPTGYLREWKYGAKRADLILVTKCPSVFSAMERRLLTDDLKPEPYQKILFSYYEYGDLTPLNKVENIVNTDYYYERNYSALLLTGIANASNLFYHLKGRLKEVTHLEYSDHHQFSSSDLKTIREVFDNIVNQNKIIIATEKDAMRLSQESLAELIKDLPIFYIPIEVKFHGDDGELFNEKITRYVRDHKIDS